jgi:hypothetical protein
VSFENDTNFQVLIMGSSLHYPFRVGPQSLGGLVIYWCQVCRLVFRRQARGLVFSHRARDSNFRYQIHDLVFFCTKCKTRVLGTKLMTWSFPIEHMTRILATKLVTLYLGGIHRRGGYRANKTSLGQPV